VNKQKKSIFKVHITVSAGEPRLERVTKVPGISASKKKTKDKRDSEPAQLFARVILGECSFVKFHIFL